MTVALRPYTRTLVMGIVNVTADSFSDGGRFLAFDAAVERGAALTAQGADIIDVGGESTRPGAVRVPAEIELGRVVPVVKELAAQGLSVSVDTMRASVAAASLEAGAEIINDVSGGRADADMARVMAEAGAPWILMHWRDAADYTHRGVAAHYQDVVADVTRELLEQVDIAVAAGVNPDNIILDPGLGFAKSAQHNWALLQALPKFNSLGFPVLIGASRKRFLGKLLAEDGVERPVAERDTATAAISALSAAYQAWAVRVHDVRATLDAVKVARAWELGRA